MQVEILKYVTLNQFKESQEWRNAIKVPVPTPEERALAEAWLRNYPPCPINEIMREAQDTGTPKQFWHWIGDGTEFDPFRKTFFTYDPNNQKV